VYLTNNFEAPALQIVILYVNRWKIELFFKWMKQHLKIKSFWGESPNAVKLQIWIAVCTFVLVVLLKKKLEIQHSLNDILQILSISILDKTPVNELFTKTSLQNSNDKDANQLTLFDF
jgi:IS4 transposase